MGGFTPLNWITIGRGQKDQSNQTFIFSLDLMKKYDLVNKNKDSIICSSDRQNLEIVILNKNQI